MSRFVKTMTGVLGLSLSHLACGACVLLDGFKSLFSKISGKTFHPQYLPWAENKKREFKTQIEKAYKNDAGSTSMSGKLEIFLGKAGSYILAYAGLLAIAAFAAPIGGIVDTAAGLLALSTGAYHLRIAVKTTFSAIKSLIPGKKAEEAVQRGRQYQQEVMRATDIPENRRNRTPSPLGQHRD